MLETTLLCVRKLYLLKCLVWNRSSRPDLFFEESALKNSAKFTGKQPCQSLFFNMVAGLGPAIAAGVFLWILRNLRISFYKEHLRWMLLYENKYEITMDSRFKTRVMKENKARKISILYWKTTKEFYHRIKFQKIIMNRWYSLKKLFLKVSQYSPENTCVGVSFLKNNPGLQACNFVKKRLQHNRFLANNLKI